VESYTRELNYEVCDAATIRRQRRGSFGSAASPMDPPSIRTTSHRVLLRRLSRMDHLWTPTL